MDIMDILSEAVSNNSSDIFIIAGMPITYKINEKFVATKTKPLGLADTEALVARIYDNVTVSSLDKVKKLGDDDFSFALPGLSRFRVNVYKQRGSLAAVIRVIRFDLPNPETVGIPKTVMDLADRRKGLILVTGTAGSGKSTTLACMIDKINKTRTDHIVTLEDPLEYLHRHDKSIISQREVHTDTESYVKALRASLRQAPDVVLLGEMRDHETISVAMTAAETGHLVFSTLHTVGAANTIDRIIDAFGANQQNQIRIQLAMVLQAVISQQLLPTEDGKLTPAFEVMIVNNAVRTMIRDAKIHQIDSVIHSSSAEGMITLDSYLINLLKAGKISSKTAIAYSTNPELMSKKI
ncbi:MAG: PilT/PilU family type 4a pilus ATPase [Firmicutes bacterium]|nr:PilT/PilU family type 4a pilus ATPase [Bacillota bacterium]